VKLPTLIICALGLPGFACTAGTLDWATVKQDIARQFPHVRQLPTSELAAWLSDTNRPAPLLLDVRTPAEYAVSHLANARQVDPDADAAKALPDTSKDTPIITYCSVGYRSSAFAERLQQAGFTNIFQLDGSIFQWVNDGRPLVRDGKPVQEVHPYNAHWGQLLDAHRQ
jgi:rhodanese-related sulfurtransferase